MKLEKKINSFFIINNNNNTEGLCVFVRCVCVCVVFLQII